MWLALKLFTAALLAVVLIEDIKYRAVHTWLFPLLLLSSFALGLERTSAFSWLNETLLNCALILGIMILATLYFSLKKRSLVVLTKGFIGWGDLLFFISMAGFFSFPDFIFLFPLSLIFSLVIWLIVSLFKGGGTTKVPLAGLQALFVILMLVLDTTGLQETFMSDLFKITTAWRS